MNTAFLLPLACATCKADPGSVMAQAQDSAVLLMLGFLTISLGFVALIVFNFVRKQQSFALAAQL